MPLPTNNKPSRGLPSRQRLPQVNLEEEVFSQVDPYEEDEYSEGIYEEEIPQPKRPAAPRRNSHGRMQGGLDNDIEPRDYDRFIDKQSKEIIPIGGKKSKLKARDVDKRKNTMVGIKIARAAVYLTLLGVLGLGIKNTFFPEQIYSKAEIEEISNQAIGKTGFPLERGRGFAQEFLKHYLSYDGSDQSRVLLEGFLNSSGPNIPISKQKLMGEPILFEEKTVSEYLGYYKFSAFLSDIDGTILNAETAELKGHWMSFYIGVVYDKDKDILSIHKDSPTLIPTYNKNLSNDVSDAAEAPIGTGEVDSAAQDKLESTIKGFLSGYAESSVDDHSAVDQYIPSEPDISLLSGFNQSVALDNYDMTIYKSTEPNQWKVDINVVWENQKTTISESNNDSNNNGVITPTFTSRYILTIDETSANKYLVTKIAPYVFIKSEENQ